MDTVSGSCDKERAECESKAVDLAVMVAPKSGIVHESYWEELAWEYFSVALDEWQERKVTHPPSLSSEG